MKGIPVQIIICLVFMLTIPVCHCSADEWEYGTGFTEELLYLHSMLNYDYHPDWARQWERQQMNACGIRASFGSISKAQLLHSEDIIVNSDLGSGWYFRTHLNWYGSRHEDIDRSSQFFEFQKKIAGPLALTAAADLRHEKDEIDGAVGVLVTSSSRENYAAFRFLWDDLCYDRRNSAGGKTDRYATGVGWLVRWEQGRWTVYTEGRYTGGFKRKYPDTEKSPDLAFHDRQYNRANLTARYDTGGKSCFEAEVSHMHFDEGKQYHDPSENYTYLHDISHGAVRWILKVRPLHQARIELHGVTGHADATGLHVLDYERIDIMPALFLRFGPARYPVELGYFSSVYDWNYDRKWEGVSETDAGYVDKLKVDWTFNISGNTRILFSLSHVVELKRFGGGNFQLQILK